jgi:hypothetical protein
MNKKPLKKMVEIKILVINLMYLIFFEYATRQYDIGHKKMIISCTIVACVIQSTTEKYDKFKYIFHPLFM